MDSGSPAAHPRVRKHPAPEGALRPSIMLVAVSSSWCQKAPSTRRCIKTGPRGLLNLFVILVRKHPAPEGALRLSWEATLARCEASESTQHQKVH